MEENPGNLALREHALDNPGPDGERRRGGGRRRVDYMQNAARLLKMKILTQFATGGHRLGAHARAARFQIVLADFRHEFLERAAEFLFGKRAADFVAAHARIGGEKFPQAGEAK